MEEYCLLVYFSWLTFYTSQGLPRDGTNHSGMGLPVSNVNQGNASLTHHWPMWWKKFLNCGFFFPEKHNLNWADKNQQHAEISCKFGICQLYALTRFRRGFLEPYLVTTFLCEVVDEHIVTTIGTVTLWADKRTPISHAVVCWTETIRTHAIGLGDYGMLNPSLPLL